MTPRLCTLDSFALESSQSDGFTIHALKTGVTLVVRTDHSSYRVTVLDPPSHSVMVHGGLFPTATAMRLSGATIGGSAVKLGWILVGLRMEFACGLRTFTSSRVRSVAIENTALAVCAVDHAAKGQQS